MLEARGYSARFVACLMVGLCACADAVSDASNADAEEPRGASSRRKPARDANIEAVTGDIAVVSGLDSVVPNESEDDSAVLIFQEQHALTLRSPLGLDLFAPGKSPEPSALAGDIQAGVTVNVYFVHFDPVGKASKHFAASIVFPDPILGVAYRMKTLDAGDAIVGRDDVEYPKPRSASERGLEYPGADKLTFEADGRTLAIDLSTSTSSDQLRVVTHAAAD